MITFVQVVCVYSDNVSDYMKCRIFTLSSLPFSVFSSRCGFVFKVFFQTTIFRVKTLISSARQGLRANLGSFKGMLVF